MMMLARPYVFHRAPAPALGLQPDARRSHPRRRSLEMTHVSYAAAHLAADDDAAVPVHHGAIGDRHILQGTRGRQSSLPDLKTMHSSPTSTWQLAIWTLRQDSGFDAVRIGRVRRVH